MDVFALVSFLIMATATHCGLSLLVCLVGAQPRPLGARETSPASLPPPQGIDRAKGADGAATHGTGQSPTQGCGIYLAHEASAKVRLGSGATITADWTRDG